MIISRVIGGLGNQMFQYAAGRALSLDRRVPFLLDIREFDHYPLHQGFELLRVFRLPTEIASQSDVRAVLGWRAHPTILRKLRAPHFAWLRMKHSIVEPHLAYWAGIQSAPSDAYLIGYWQSEKYFHRYSSMVRADFAFANELSEINREFASKIITCNAVSLHVRRGDYVSNPTTNSVHGLCSIDYYTSAIELMVRRVSSPEFFVFSDDIDWARSHLRLENPCHWIAHNAGMESYNDMRLMAMCKHHIIANSSFSWWGAWLNPSADKVVIAPKRWFADNRETSDLIPTTWIRI